MAHVLGYASSHLVSGSSKRWKGIPRTLWERVETGSLVLVGLEERGGVWGEHKGYSRSCVWGAGAGGGQLKKTQGAPQQPFSAGAWSALSLWAWSGCGRRGQARERNERVVGARSSPKAVGTTPKPPGVSHAHFGCARELGRGRFNGGGSRSAGGPATSAAFEGVRRRRAFGVDGKVERVPPHVMRTCGDAQRAGGGP